MRCGILTAMLLLQAATVVHGAGILPDPGPQQFLAGYGFFYTEATNADYLFDNNDQHGPLVALGVGIDWKGDGAAVSISTNVPSVLAYRITETDGTNNFSIPQGSWLGWLAPDWTSADQTNGTGPGCYGRIFETGFYTTNASVGFLGLFLDPAGETLIFAGQTNNGNGAVYATAAVSFAITNQFNQVGVTWSAAGSAIYLNGVCLTNGLGVAYYPNGAAASNSWRIGSDAAGVLQARASFDDVFTFSNVLSASKVAQWYDGAIGGFTINPLNDANIYTGPSFPAFVMDRYDVVSGPGNLILVSNATTCVSNPNVWLTNVLATAVPAWGINLQFTVMGGTNGSWYDVFAAGTLSAGSLTNSTWTWMGQVPGDSCGAYVITNLPPAGACLVLGSTHDSTGCGLSDAYIHLVLHGDPSNPVTADGLPYAWCVLAGLDPKTASLGSLDPDLDALVNTNEYLFGSDPVKSEGMGVFVANPGASSAIP